MTLSRAMSVTIPLSLLFIALSMMFAFKRDVRDFFVDLLAFKGRVHEDLRQWRDWIGSRFGRAPRRRKSWETSGSLKGEGHLGRKSTYDPPRTSVDEERRDADTDRDQEDIV
jgi:hypothetical protein